MEREVYHTQEKRHQVLTGPCECTRDDAWLGNGYYFWYDLDDAEKWGRECKVATGRYDVYKAKVDCSDVLDTVFNEEHYLFWLRQIEKAAKQIVIKTGQKPTIKELNDYFKQRAMWSEVTGIMFQDLPTNFNYLMVKPIEYRYKKQPFAYKKRIQIVVYNIEIICTFALVLTDTCKI